MDDSSPARLAGDAARLVSYGLRPRLRPDNEPVYDQLLQRYRTDPSFRELTRAVVDGLGLQVLDAGAFGLALAPQDGSVFALRLADYRHNLSVDDRLLHGLVHLAVAAYCYPTAVSLDDDAAVQRVSVHCLERYLRDACAALAEQQGDIDPAADQPELEQAWRIFHRRNATRHSESGRRATKATVGIISHCLETLADHGFLRRSNDEEGGTYQALARYRTQVRELAAHEGYRLLVAGNAPEGAPA